MRKERMELPELTTTFGMQLQLQLQFAVCSLHVQERLEGTLSA